MRLIDFSQINIQRKQNLTFLNSQYPRQGCYVDGGVLIGLVKIWLTSSLLLSINK